MPPANRQRVLRAATASFLVDGYRSSVDSIAQRAGVAKQTVYSHFPSKDELFKEVARGLANRVLVQLETDSQDVRQALLRFASAYRSKVLCTEGIAMFRALVSEIPRFRTLARAIFAGGPGETARGLAEFLGNAMNAGELRKDDPQFAAELLLGMLVGHERIKRVYGVAKFANGGDARHAARIVDCFLRMYSTEKRP
jgi:TetR/AcrR family transcriptional repressor of mexJK operon